MSSRGSNTEPSDVPVALAQQIAHISICEMAYSVTLADPSLPDCPLIGCSEGFEKLTGYSKPEIVGRNCRFLNKGTTLAPAVRKALQEATTSGQEFIGVLPNRMKNGTLFLNLLHMSTLNVRGRKYVIGVQADVTHVHSDMDFAHSGHIKEVRSVASRICRNMEAWVQMQAHEFAMRLPGSALPGLITSDRTAQPKKKRLDKNECADSIGKRGTDKVANMSQLRRKVTPSTAAGEDSDTGSTNAATTEALEGFDDERDAGPSTGSASALAAKAGEPQEELPSAGSVGHPDNCTECMHFIFGRAGCRDGVDCRFCHSFHPRKNPKKNRRHHKRFEALVVAAGATIAEETEEPPPTSVRTAIKRASSQGRSTSSGGPTPPPTQEAQTSTAAAVVPSKESAFLRQVSEVSNCSADSRSFPLRQDLMSFCYGEAFEASDQVAQVVCIAGQQMRVPAKVTVTEANQQNEQAFLDSVSFSVEPPLPNGLNLDPKTGQISGAPTTPTEETGTHVFTASLEAKGPNGVCLGLLPVATSTVSIAVVDVGMYAISWSAVEDPGVQRGPDEHPSTNNVRFKAHYEMK